MNGAVCSRAFAVKVTVGQNCDGSSTASAARISASASHALSRLAHVRRRVGAEMSAMIVILVGAMISVGAAFAQQEIGQQVQFVVGDGGAYYAAPLFFLPDKPGLRQYFRVMSQGRSCNPRPFAQFSDAQTFG